VLARRGGLQGESARAFASRGLVLKKWRSVALDGGPTRNHNPVRDKYARPTGTRLAPRLCRKLWRVTEELRGIAPLLRGLISMALRSRPDFATIGCMSTSTKKKLAKPRRTIAQAASSDRRGPGMNAILLRARTPYQNRPLSEDDALNLICEARETEQTYPIERLVAKFG